MAKVLIKKETIDPYFDNVSLLLPFDSNFQDFSTNNLTLTVDGSPSISNFIRRIGNGSAFFDGDGDFLQTNSISLGSDNFTLESWIYLTTYGSANNPIFNQGNTDTTGAFLVLIGSAENDRYLIFYANNYERFRGTTIIPLNTWTHIAVSRQSNIYYFFINGILEGVHAGVYDHTQLPFKIGDGYGGVRYFDGYIDSLRVTEGVARYTANFTPPNKLSIKSGKLNIQRGGVDPFFNNVSLLLPMNTSFADFSSNNFALTAFGNVQISNAESKFGGGSAFFDGDGDYLELPINAIQFNTDDFTIEFWVHPTRTGSHTCVANWGCSSNMTIFLAVSTSEGVVVYLNGTGPYIAGGSVQANQWQHVTLVRQGGNMKAYINGVQAGSTYNIGNTAINTIVDNIRIGRDTANFNCNPPLEGYMNDLRITIGVARYTADFTPPNSSFSAGKSGKVNISKPVFPSKDLLAFWKLNDTSDSSGNNNSLTNNNGVVFGEPGVVGNGARTTWGNNGSYLTTNLSVNGDSTLSLWFRFDSLPVPNPQGYQDRYPLVFQKYPYCALGTNSNYPRKLILTDLATWGFMSTNEIFTVGQWCHIVTVIENSKAKVYADGVLILETPAQYTNTFQSGGRLLGFGGDNVDLATSYGTDTRYDSIGMWSRALTYNEVMALYNNGAGLEP